MEIRIANENDYTKLRDLWQEVFGDSSEYIDNLYDSLDATGYVLLEEGKVVSCLTVFDVGTFEGKPISEIYAVCTKNSARENGYASKLVAFVRDEIKEDGKVAMICPASEMLIEFYSKLDFEPYFYVCKKSKALDISRIELNDAFNNFVLSEGEIESAEALDLSDTEIVIEGMINKDSSLSNPGGKYPYFGFPMK